MEARDGHTKLFHGLMAKASDKYIDAPPRVAEARIQPKGRLERKALDLGGFKLQFPLQDLKLALGLCSPLL